MKTAFNVGGGEAFNDSVSLWRLSTTMAMD